MKQAIPFTKEKALIPVNNKCDSLKTTVPKWLIEAFALKKGDKITWIYSPQKNSVSIEIPISSGNEGGGV
jgi:hypothetical protein